MKHLAPLVIIIAVLSSCGNMNQFSKQKFTKLRKIKTQSEHSITETATQSLESNQADTLKLKSGEILEVKIVEQSEKKVRFKKNCNDCEIVYTKKRKDIDAIIIDKRKEAASPVDSSKTVVQPLEPKEKNKKLMRGGLFTLLGGVASLPLALGVAWVANWELGGLIWSLIFGSIIGFILIITGIVWIIMGANNKKLRKSK